MRSILEELFYGNVCPNTDCRSQDKETKELIDKRQLKLFYSVLVHYWLKSKSFISKQNFFNLWCELN